MSFVPPKLFIFYFFEAHCVSSKRDVFSDTRLHFQQRLCHLNRVSFSNTTLHFQRRFATFLAAFVPSKQFVLATHCWISSGFLVAHGCFSSSVCATKTGCVLARHRCISSSVLRHFQQLFCLQNGVSFSNTALGFQQLLCHQNRVCFSNTLLEFQ